MSAHVLLESLGFVNKHLISGELPDKALLIKIWVAVLFCLLKIQSGK